MGVIVKEEGIGGLYKGLAPTMLKQGCNQASRFVVFKQIEKAIQTYTGRPKMSATESMAAGGLAGTISVYATMP